MRRTEDKTTRNPMLGNALAIASGFSFYILCMSLSLVGPAGSRVPEAGENRTTFLSVLLFTMLLAGASIYVALQRRKTEGTPLPRFSIGLAATCIVVLVILFFNGFAI